MATTEHRHRHSKRRHVVYFDLTETADDRFDRIIEGLLITLLAFSPLAFGAVQAWSQLVFIVIAAGMALCLGIKLLCRPDVRFVWSWTYLPIAAFLLIVAVQLLPLPMPFVRMISPQTADLKTSLLSPLPDSARHLRSTTLSFYPEATWQNLRLLLAISAIYVVTLNSIRQTKQLERLLLAITTIGAVFAVICFAHLGFDLDSIYGIVPGVSRAWPIAPFINRNHFGQFMNLSLGAAVALLLMQLEQFLRSWRRSAAPDDLILPAIPPILWGAGTAIVLMGVGVFLSLSRGAMLSMVVSACLATLMARRKGMHTRMWLLLPLAFAVALLVIYFGFDVIVGRFLAADETGNGRLQIVLDVLNASKQYPVLGTGLGTFETVYPMFDSSTIVDLATHAENEYAQILLEGGILGLGVVVLFVAIVASKYVRCIRSAPSSMAQAAIGLGFGLVAMLVQSASDFGQHMPANAAMTAVGCAMLLTFAESSRRITAGEPASRIAHRLPRIAGVVLTAVVAWLICLDAGRSAQAEWHWFTVRDIETTLRDHDWRGDDNEYRRLLIAADLAAQRRPDDIHYRYWLNFFRWKLISREVDPKTGQLLFTDQQLHWAGQIARELLDGAPACPTYGPTYLLAGQIQRNILSQEDGVALVRTAFMLSHTDPIANFETALIEARQGQWEPAMTKFRHAADLMPQYLAEGVDALTRDLHRPDLAIQLADQSVPAVRRIVAILDKMGDASLPVANKRLADLIRAHAAEPGASAEDLVDAARLASSEKSYSDAVSLYKRAMIVSYTHPDWQLEMARALAGAGSLEEAMDAALIARRLAASGAESLILELRLRPTTEASTTTPPQPSP